MKSVLLLGMKMKKISFLIFALLLSLSASAAEFTLKSSAFPDNTRIPKIYTCDGKNINPPLSWENVPPKTESFVLMLTTVAWGREKVYLWALYNIPADVNHLDEGSESYAGDTKVGMNFYNEAAYHGPCPPDTNVDHYFFTLYALDKKFVPIEDEMDPEELLIKIKPHILKQAQWRGFYSH